MVTIDESRKRTIFIVAFTIIVGASLGYVYTYAQSNRLLENKYAALKYNYDSCNDLYNKCEGRLNVCVSSGQKLQDAEKELQVELEAGKSSVYAVQKSLEESQGKYAVAIKFFSDVGALTGLDADSVKEVTPDVVTSIMEKLNDLAHVKTEYEEFKTKYTSLEYESQKLTAVKESLEQKVQHLEDAKKAIEESYNRLKSVQGSTTPSDKKEGGVVDDLNKMINSETQTADEIKEYLKTLTVVAAQPTAAGGSQLEGTGPVADSA